MVLYRVLLNVNVLLTVSVSVAAVLGDYLITICNSPLGKALCDNITHALIGGLAWTICYLNRAKTLEESDQRHGALEVLACTFLSSVIDLDHFIAARSTLLKNATALMQRPFLHCSTTPLVLFLVLLLVSQTWKVPAFKQGALIGLTAFATHHIRDAARRGLWLYPFGSTAPIPYWLYIALCALVPYVVIFLDKSLKQQQRVMTNDGYSHVV
ncbi:hypothetical protein HUJ04_006336 [Dendroctonus ponderosae]|uniref:Transmembrane protein 267 n=1 Tax=Dendroctonus ponderosae TaxID=77166 RepID=A0AAR5PMW2_DENPD|nr:hypothetical protein HUJ04_006336 [Dendroctonus ponderosae]